MIRLSATWENVTENAAEPSSCWGSRGRRFKSCQPDLLERLRRSEACGGVLFIYADRFQGGVEPFTRHPRERIEVHSERCFRSSSPILRAGTPFSRTPLLGCLRR